MDCFVRDDSSAWTFLGLYLLKKAANPIAIDAPSNQWGVLHLNAGLLFCIAMLLHTALNWKALVRYGQRLHPHWSLSPVLLSLTLTIYVCLGGAYDLPPIKQCIDIARSCRLDSVKKYGSPPYGIASHYPVAQIAMYMGWDPKKAIAQLNEHHIVVCNRRNNPGYTRGRQSALFRGAISPSAPLRGVLLPDSWQGGKTHGLCRLPALDTLYRTGIFGHLLVSRQERYALDNGPRDK